MHCIYMLPQIVKPRKGPAAATLERPFAGVLADMSSQVFRATETHAAITESLALKKFTATAHLLEIPVRVRYVNHFW